MKPASMKALYSGNLLQNINDRANLVIAKLGGETRRQDSPYENAFVVLYNKANLTPLAVRKPDINGHYQFLGLNTAITCFIVAIDRTRQYNAVIQDNVVPK